MTQPYERILLENLNTAVLVFNQQLVVTYINPAGEMLFSMSGRHMLGMHAKEIIPCGDENAVRHLEQAWKSGHAITEREVIVRFPGQSTSLTIDCTVTPFNDDNEGALLVEIQQVDRQLRISREEQLLAQQEVSHQLIRGLAHEIKNPLGGIRGAAQLLEQELKSKELGEYTDIIIAEADRLRALVDRMLGPRDLPNLEWLNIHVVLEHVRQLVRAEVGSQVEMIRDYDPSIPDLQADQGQLIQAFLNIMRNAVKAMNGKGEMRIRTRILRHYTIGSRCYKLVLQADIVDNGPGIPREMQEQIFFPMITGSPDGTGLGLTIAQSLVGAHGGLIECHSEPGETTFSVFLPLELKHVS